MINKITLYTQDYDYIFSEETNKVEIKLGSITNEFWGENISMVSAIVGKKGVGKSTILRSILDSDQIGNVIYYSPHLDYFDNYDFEINPNNISLDTILRRDLQSLLGRKSRD